MSSSIKLGKWNTLKIVKEVDFGIYLDGKEEGEILLPTRYVPEMYDIGEMLTVFIYLDSEERIIATTLTPLVQVGEFACLKVNWVNEYGAFLDWGLMKDLFVPFREQKQKMLVDRSYVVYVYVDEESFRIVGSAKVDKFLSKAIPTYEINQEVDLLIWQKTDLGYKAIINNEFCGLLYDSEIFQQLLPDMRMKAFIKQIREDGKIDLVLQKPGFEKVDATALMILERLKKANGFLAVTDKSDADQIYTLFEVSKKTFKKAIGDLYKKKLIQLLPTGIQLVL